MSNDWSTDLQSLKQTQADLRSRLADLDLRITRLEHLAEKASSPIAASAPPKPMPADLPAFDSPVGKLAEVPPPLPEPPVETKSPIEPEQRNEWEPVFIEEKKPQSPPPLPSQNLEMKVGQYWLVRIGILVLLTGLVLLGNLAYQNIITKFGAPGKLAMLYLAAALLSGVGFWLERKMKQTANYARVLIAGGAATFYYTTYAAHFVTSLRVIESPLVGGVLLLLLAGAFAWFAERRKSEGVAFLAVLLSYYTSAINPATNFTLFSNVLLTALAVFLLVRHRWLGVTWLGLIGTYGSFLYWQSHNTGFVAAGLTPSHGFLLAYWLIFTTAVFFRKAGTFEPGQRSVFLTINNLAFFALSAPAVYHTYPDAFWAFSVGFGLALLGLSVLAWAVRRDEGIFDGAYLAQGLLVVTLGLVAKFSVYQLSIILAMEAAAFVFCSQYRHRPLFMTGAVLSALGAFFLMGQTFLPGEGLHWLAPSAVAALLLLSAYLVKHVRGELAALSWSWSSAYFSWLGLVLTGLLLVTRFENDAAIQALAVAAVVFTVILPFLRLPEVSLGAQGFLLAACGALLIRFFTGNLAWTNTVPILVVSLGLMHWWQFQKHFAPSLARIVETCDSLMFSAVLMLWLLAQPSRPEGMVAMTLIGGGVLAYAVVTRALSLAVFSQAFVVVGVAACGAAMVQGHPAWYLPLAVMIILAAHAMAIGSLAAAGRPALELIQTLYHFAILFLGLMWIWEYVPGDQRALVCSVVAGVVFLPGVLRKNEALLAQSIILLMAGFLWHCARVVMGEPVSGLDALSLLIMLALPQLGRRFAPELCPGTIRAVISVAAMGALWVQSTRWASEAGFASTISWSLLAFGLLGVGFLLRERVFRLMGLLVLAVAVGHVFFVDVWKMGQVAGILGIIGLALVLLAIGFIYNRFADQIRKWL